MSNRPTTLLKDGTLYWVLSVYDSSGVLVDADSTPSVAVRKNGSATTESVTVTKRGSSTGLYDCSLNPSLEAEGDTFHLEEQLDISSVTYNNTWSVVVTEPMITSSEVSTAVWDVPTSSYLGAGTFGLRFSALNTTTPDNTSITAIKTITDQMVFTIANELDCNAVSGGGGDATAANQAAISNAIAALNDFDPATDTVITDTASRNASKADVSGLATSAEVTAVGSAVTGNASAIAVVDAVVDAIKVTTDKLDTALVLDGSVYQYTANALELAPTGGGGGGDATLAKQNTIIADIAALNDFDPSSQTVANVTTVGTCTTNSDMRGTDNANTLAPANGDITGIKAKTDSLTFTGNDVNANVQAGSSDATAANQVAIQNAIAALNDFDPGSDTVANVTDVALVAVCATNSDMRGTDSANTIAPDNAGITANGVAVASLNDFDPATQAIANVTNVATTGVCVSNTDMRGTDGANTVVPDNAGIAANGTALAATTKTGVQYTATAQSGDTIQVTLS